MKNKEFVTSINVTDVQKTDLGGDRGFGSVVRGQFTFDGRIRSDQVGRFNTIVAPGEHAQHVETVFTVKVVKAKHVQWRDMNSFAEGEADLNKAVAQAAAWSPHKDSKDPLEIPNFLKRS
jgi:hypothetical protein